MEIRGQVVYRSPTMTAHFDMSYPGIARYAVQSHELGAVLDYITDAAKNYAEAISPYQSSDDAPADSEDGHREPAYQEHYRDAWESVAYTEVNTGKPPFPRQARLLLNQSPHAVFVEFGNGRTEGEHILDKTIDYIVNLGRTS